AQGLCLLVNARLVPAPGLLGTLQQLLAAGRPTVVRDSAGAVAIALLDHATLPAAFHLDTDALIEQLVAPLPVCESVADTFQWPHEVIQHHMRNMPAALQWRIEHGDYTQQQDGLFVAPGVTMEQSHVSDTSKGPIILEQDVRVGPFCYLSGPVYIGARSRIIEHAALKDAVALGHTTKVGGEVEASTIEPYSNKQHHGFLGH